MDFDKLREWVQAEISAMIVEKTLSHADKHSGLGVNREPVDKLFEELKKGTT